MSCEMISHRSLMNWNNKKLREFPPHNLLLADTISNKGLLSVGYEKRRAIYLINSDLGPEGPNF